MREAIGEELTSFLSVAEQRLAQDGAGRLDWLEVGLRDMFLSGSSRYPLDEALQLLDGFTPATAKLICRFASREPYQVASTELAATTGLQIDARRIQRLVQKVGPAFRRLQNTLPQQKDTVPRMYVLADGTGVPMRPDVLKGRKGKQPDGSAKTQEVKVGCVFTEHPKPAKIPCVTRTPQPM